jgi:hypothetical protein
MADPDRKDAAKPGNTDAFLYARIEQLHGAP